MSAGDILTPTVSGDLLDRLRAALRRIEPFSSSGVPGDTVVEPMAEPSEVLIDGRRVLMFGSNNYLGLTSHPEVVEAAARALQQYGTGTTGSRVANGTLLLHRRLEQQLARFFEVPHAVVFTTGYQANLSVIGALCGPESVALVDAESHASIWDAARLSGAIVMPFRHNSPDSLDEKLRRLPATSLARLVVVEGLYSIRADTGPMRDIVTVARAHGAHLLVDEAHSFGVYGPRGRGWCEEQGVLADVDFIVGTFSKSLGGVGGFCASKHPELRGLPFVGRSYMFTAAGAPATVAGAAAALGILEREPWLRERLWAAIARLRVGLQAQGYRLSPTAAPIVPIFTGDEGRTIRFWQELLKAGVYVNIVVPPACQGDDCLLRASCSAIHTDDQVDRALEIFAQVGARSGFLRAPASRHS